MFLAFVKFQFMPPVLKLEAAKMEEGQIIAGLEHSDPVYEQKPVDPDDLKKMLVYKKNDELIASIRGEHE